MPPASPRPRGPGSSRQRALRKLVLGADAALVVAAMALAAEIHGALRAWVPAVRVPPRFDEYAVLVYLALPVYLGLVVAFDLHRVFERTWTRTKLVWDLGKLHAASFFALSALGFLTQSVVNRTLVGAFLISTYVLLLAQRFLLSRWVAWQHASGQAQSRIVLVGEPSPALVDFVRAAREEALSPHFVGRIAEAGEQAPEPGGAGELPPLLGTLADLEALLHEGAVDTVLFFSPPRSPEHRAAMDTCRAHGVPAGVAIADEYEAAPTITYLHGRPFVTHELAPKRPELLALKHAFDFVAAAAGLVLVAPLLALAALAILVTMGRPIFFLQERAGLHGRRFRMIKLRTMVADAEQQRAALEAQNELSGPTFKVRRDPRVTPLGRWLRRTSVDELPQLFNVLAGSMSLVGPRPLPLREQEQIRGFQRRRLSMKPGITGLWQVSGRSDVDFEDWMRLDLRYVDRWSPRLDGEILMKTIPAVLFGRGAR